MTDSLRHEVSIEGLGEPLSHYCHAVRFGDLLFVSGCAPFDDSGVVAEGDVVAQTRFVLETMGRVLEAGGSSFADVLKVTVYLTDIADRQAINPLRQEFFGSARPASTLVEVTALALPGMLVEFEAVAGVVRSA